MTAARNRTLGRHGEEVAARHLTALGMVLLDRNWRCPEGEIDLVLRDGSTLVVCEVKTRSDESFGHPLQAVTDAKAGRLRRLAVRWLEAHEVRPADVRIDLVGVLRAPRGPAVITHVRGIA